MKKFPMFVRDEVLYSRFIEILNHISDNLILTCSEYTRIERDFLLHLINENKGHIEYNEILGTIAELVALYDNYQRFIDTNELFTTITNLLRSEYCLSTCDTITDNYPPKAPKHAKAKDTIGKHKATETDEF